METRFLNKIIFIFNSTVVEVTFSLSIIFVFLTVIFYVIIEKPKNYDIFLNSIIY